MSFAARFPGVCASCRERIEIADQIDFTSLGVVVHADCLESYVEKVERAVTICPICHLQQPCECE